MIGFGTSRLDATRSTKIFQLEELSYRAAKTTLKALRRAGILTFQEVSEHRLLLRWEPRVFPRKDIKPQARWAITVEKYDLTLAFANKERCVKFKRWLLRRRLLTDEPSIHE